MNRIAINGINSKTGGGKSILVNYMKLLDKEKHEDRYFLLTTEREEFDWISNDHIFVIKLPGYYARTALAPFVYEFLIGKILKKTRVDVVLNFGSLIINSDTPQVYLFQWAYAIYPKSVIWKWMDLRAWLRARIKLYFLKKRLHDPSVVAAQTPVAKRALENLYGLTRVKIIPNAVPLDNLAVDSRRRFKLPCGRRLLYLTYYYLHKNLEVLIPLARRIKASKCDYKIIITMSAGQHPKAAKLLQDIEDQSLDDIIVNIGPVAMTDVPALYRLCDGLLMPSILESFSGTYVEAMYHEIPIFTSDLDFARAVCADAACYFDPHDPDDILCKLNNVFNTAVTIESLTGAGRRVLRNLPDWSQVFGRFQDILQSELKRIPLNRQ